jgi:MscS family membrane protein
MENEDVETPSTCGLLVSLILIPPAFAQSPAPPPRPLPSEETPQDPLGRSTPRGTVLGFIKAAQTENYPLAVEFLDTRQPAGSAQGIARELKVILDRGLQVNLDTLSTKLDGDLDDGLPTRESWLESSRPIRAA